MITHPEKVLFPDDGISKGELAAYYEAVAPAILPHLRGRPLTMERYPAGIQQKGFIQKDVSKGFPEWLERIEVSKQGGSVWHPIVNDLRSLLWVTNQNSITPHVWTSTTQNLHEPNLCVFDLDPSVDDAPALKAAALAVRELLAELGLPSWLKTSGSKGFHIAVPLDERSDFDTVSEFAHGVGAVLVKRNPTRLTQEFIKADREGRILVDTGRNRYGATFAATYAVRAKPGAPVSAPCTWEELEHANVGPQSFSLRTLPQRLDELGDLWAVLHEHSAGLSQPLAQLHALLSEEDWSVALKALGRKPKAKSAAKKRR